MSQRPPTTQEILGLRRIGRAADQRFVDWAIDMLASGRDSRSLRILAGELPPFHWFELAALVDRSIGELGLEPMASDEQALAAIAKALATRVVHGELDRLTALHELQGLYFEFDLPRVLQDFAHLVDARHELQTEDRQWYWRGLDRSNIDEWIDSRFRAAANDEPWRRGDADRHEAN